MFLKISTPDRCLFEGKIKKVVIPTESWEIWILPWHIPLVSVVKPWIVKINLEEPTKYEHIIKDSDFLYQDEELKMSVSKWLVFVDWENITITVSSTISSNKNDEELLLKMKQDLEKEIQELKLKWSIEDMERVLIDIQKISADLKLLKMRWMAK